MNEDTMKDIIRDAHALAESSAAEDLIRAGAETIARRLERLVAHGLYITPKAALDVVAGERPLDMMLKTPMSEGVKECGSEGVKKPVLIGNFSNKTAALSFSFLDGLDIQVTAREVRQGQWTIEGRSRGTCRIMASVFGGRGTARRYARFIRNGMVSRAMKLKHNQNRRAANPSNPSNPSNLSNLSNLKLTTNN